MVTTRGRKTVGTTLEPRPLTPSLSPNGVAEGRVRTPRPASWQVHGPDLATAGVCLFTSYSPAGVNNLRLTTVLVASMCEVSRL